MPTILQINDVVNTGSTGRIVEQIGIVAMRNGWESYVAYGRYGNLSDSKTIKIGNKFSLYSHVLGARLFDKAGLYSDDATKKLIKTIKDIKPDIIHLHTIYSYYLNYKILFDFLSGSGIPVVWTLHDCWSMTGHCTYFTDVNCVKWKEGCYSCPKKRFYPKSIFLDNSPNNYLLKKQTFNSTKNLTIVPVSKWLESVVRESFLADCSIQTIYNGVDLDQFHPFAETDNIRIKYGLQGKHVLLALATTWGERKGWTDYMKLSRMLPENYMIVLVGLKQDEIKKLPTNIKGIKRTENIQELAELYSMADIVMNLAYQETFGLTTAEGLACGTPSIVYNTTASPELVSPGTGIIVSPGNLKQVVAAIEEIRKNGKDFYSANCRKRAEEMFGAKERYNDYFQLYNNLTNNY